MSAVDKKSEELERLLEQVSSVLGGAVISSELFRQELTLTLKAETLKASCLSLRDDVDLRFNTLIDLCGVDYLHYGKSEWQTQKATSQGFGRAVQPLKTFTSHDESPNDQGRFAVVYHLLSVKYNRRIRLKVFIAEDLMVDSIMDVWPAADWFEREAFDLFGFLFKGHPDLRRILTDYGFVGHPFRKDFPLTGHVEMRYDAALGRCVYEATDIRPRVGVPKVIRGKN